VSRSFPILLNLNDLCNRMSAAAAAQVDIIIVGGGIAGLYCAVRLQKKYPGRRIALFEKYGVLGGRASTFKMARPHIQWEEGAGRISREHRLVLKLLSEYNLHTVPISPELNYKQSYDSPMEPNLFEPAMSLFLEFLEKVPAEILATMTLRQIFKRVHGEAMTTAYFNRFPYRGEIDVMRADMAIALFKGEMGSHEGYSVCREGLSELIHRMTTDFKRRGGIVKVKHALVECVESPKGVSVVFEHGEKRIEYVTEHLILAMDAPSLQKIPLFAGWSVLKHLKMTALLRVYAAYPLNPATKEAWFAGLPRVVTDTPIRYFLPINPKSGQAMISYTDTQDADPLMAMSEYNLKRFIHKELRHLFSDRHIPHPTVFKKFGWKHGVTYWLPGKYDPRAASREAITFSKRIHVCGESFSLRQGWMEGSLEHAEELLDYISK
jgi:protoporphyrinogen oxidase